jgi:hypothetical protein
MSLTPYDCLLAEGAGTIMNNLSVYDGERLHASDSVADRNIRTANGGRDFSFL